MTDNTHDRMVSRRNVLTGIGSALGAATLAPTVQAERVIEDQFLVDTESAGSTAWRESVEIIDEAPKAGFASVRGDEGALDQAGLRFAQEVELKIAPPETPDGAPAATESASDISPSDHDAGSGTPSPHPFQWDKKAQDIEQLHEQGITGEGATIAVVDSGIDLDHPDLEVNEELSENFSAGDSIGAGDEYHGTHVAGIAAATGGRAGEGGAYVVGVAPDAELIDMKTFPFLSSASFLNAIETAAVRGADVINMSFGPGAPYGPSVASDLNEEAYQRVSAIAREEGALLVESAGNFSVNIDAVEELVTNAGKDTPANYLRVSATGPFTDPETIPEFGSIAPTHLPAYYTSYGPDAVDVSAAGGNVLATDFDGVLSTMPSGVEGGFTRVGPDNLYGTLHGTSMAAPNAAGLAALVKSQNPNATPAQLKNHLRNTARTIDTEYVDVFDLFGINIGYFENEVPGLFDDFELEDPYTSQTYRGAGHVDASQAATKDVAFAGGLTVAGETYLPSDLDDDGLYEDVNGDGVVDMDDAQVLYQTALRGAPADASEAFDFNGDGRFDMRDVQAFIRLYIN